jgi:hypothetical protein
LVGVIGTGAIARAQTGTASIEQALQNIISLSRPGKVGYAALWDGNKFVQCRRMSDSKLRCEAAGSVMQPSLRNVLTGERLNRLAALGWALDPNFGNYVRTFSPDIPLHYVATQIAQVLSEVYDANVAKLEAYTRWMDDVPCPPRSGPSQNLAGSVNDAPSMRAVAILDCSYTAPSAPAQKIASADDLIAFYGAAVTAEIQRLRINSTARVFVIFDAGIGYVQCAPDDNAIYCEAQSEESWPALAAILTPDRVAWLKTAGYSDPGRAPNYWKIYPFDKFPDPAIAGEILTILYRVYGYAGAAELKIKTE